MPGRLTGFVCVGLGAGVLGAGCACWVAWVCWAGRVIVASAAVAAPVPANVNTPAGATVAMCRALIVLPSVVSLLYDDGGQVAHRGLTGSSQHPHAPTRAGAGAPRGSPGGRSASQRGERSRSTDATVLAARPSP